MLASFRDEDYPELPYPGARPDMSFVSVDGMGSGLRPDSTTPSGWRVEPTGVDLDEWLARWNAPPLADRVPVLAYGSNACPSKISWLRDELGLAGPAVVLTAQCDGLAAAWTTGLRVRDGQRPATLVRADGVVEQHAVWLATSEQVRVLDICEGRGRNYRLVRVHTGRVVLADESVVDGVLAYTAASAARAPLLVEGQAVRCADVDQAEAVGLSGTPAPSDGLEVSDVDGPPRAEDWPDRLFVYGTLQPGSEAWRVAAPLVADAAMPAEVAGLLHDTGLGYPALRLSGGSRVPGFVLRLRSPATALPVLDEYEGTSYRRVRVALPDGLVCWTYVWTASVRDMPVLSRGWAAR
jgi:gamma-glutamylcyclotransferase (GGCT)/AIG2-like uncharacterized protein YtfP